LTLSVLVRTRNVNISNFIAIQTIEQDQPQDTSYETIFFIRK